jgi:transcriptional antiterminator NusG
MIASNENTYFYDVALPKRKKRKSFDKVVSVKLYPSVVFLKMKMNLISYKLINKIQYVVGFGKGSSNKDLYPLPLTFRETENMLNSEKIFQKKDKKSDIPFDLRFKKGDKIRITEGPFKGKKGNISRINTVKGYLIVDLPLFSKNSVPTKIFNFNFCEKI